MLDLRQMLMGWSLHRGEPSGLLNILTALFGWKTSCHDRRFLETVRRYVWLCKDVAGTVKKYLYGGV